MSLNYAMELMDAIVQWLFIALRALMDVLALMMFKWLKSPGMSVLTVMTMVAVLPTITEIATIGKTLTSAFIASLYFMVII